MNSHLLYDLFLNNIEARSRVLRQLEMPSIFFLTSPLRNPPPRGRLCFVSYRFSDRLCVRAKREIASL